MLFEAILYPIFTLLEFLTNSFPLIAFPLNIFDGLIYLLDLWNSIDKFVPVNFCLLLIGSYWTIVNGKLLIALLTWLYHKIPFI